ncbi:MAG TPA: hypothetical protein PKV15_06055 [Syntrophomonadaceae bacterium]|nr:hypothetical protein [Syntrophomonadaceae bacterium]HRX22018.1 hypothetical protein [Syntrophomonadaceae bacterium]
MNTNIFQLRERYETRLVFRISVFILALVMYFVYPQSFKVMNGFNFLHQLSWLHLLWIIWVIDMIRQFIPKKGHLPLGSLKQFKQFYIPIRKLLDEKEILLAYKKNALDSLKVLVIWTFLVAFIGVLWWAKVLKARELLLITAAFYVLDLVFVLYWCPFRVWILKNRCCTTCRIFNWDHLMMFSPIIFVPGFFSFSLFGLSLVIFFAWEIAFMIYPERFCEETNEALQCRNCTDKLCGNKLIPRRNKNDVEFINM